MLVLPLCWLPSSWALVDGLLQGHSALSTAITAGWIVGARRVSAMRFTGVNWVTRCSCGATSQITLSRGTLSKSTSAAEVDGVSRA